MVLHTLDDFWMRVCVRLDFIKWIRTHTKVSLKKFNFKIVDTRPHMYMTNAFQCCTHAMNRHVQKIPIKLFSRERIAVLALACEHECDDGLERALLLHVGI